MKFMPPVPAAIAARIAVAFPPLPFNLTFALGSVVWQPALEQFHGGAGKLFGVLRYNDFPFAIFAANVLSLMVKPHPNKQTIKIREKDILAPCSWNLQLYNQPSVS
jgi:hypothetical protein